VSIRHLKLVNSLLKKSLEEEIYLIHSNLSKVFNDISVTVPYESNVAKKIATFLEGGFAFCFASPSLLSAGTRFKNSLNENAKVHCLKDSILEASHNEIVPFTFNHYNYSPHKVLLLRWQQDRSIVIERFNKVRFFFGEIGQPLMELIAVEESLVNAIISSIYILDYATIYMAVSRNLDPSPTPAVDILKRI